jgi:hypothetical protein
LEGYQKVARRSIKSIILFLPKKEKKKYKVEIRILF